MQLISTFRAATWQFAEEKQASRRRCEKERSLLSNNAHVSFKQRVLETLSHTNTALHCASQAIDIMALYALIRTLLYRTSLNVSLATLFEIEFERSLFL